MHVARCAGGWVCARACCVCVLCVIVHSLCGCLNPPIASFRQRSGCCCGRFRVVISLCREGELGNVLAEDLLPGGGGKDFEHLKEERAKQERVLCQREARAHKMRPEENKNGSVGKFLHGSEERMQATRICDRCARSIMVIGLQSLARRRDIQHFFYF